MTSEAIFETSEVAYDLSFELIDLDYLCFRVSMVSNCHHSQDVTTSHTTVLHDRGVLASLTVNVKK